MKTRLYSLLLMMATLMTLNSCDLVLMDMTPDTAEARDLSGEWTGDFGMYYEYNYRGRLYRYDSYHTDLKLTPRYACATYGDGYQVDWYDCGPYRYLNYYFKWEVRCGDIYLTYPGNHEWDTVIRDYSLTCYNFRGYFGSSNDRFCLRKIADYYDWSCYYGCDFGWDCYTGWDYYPYGYDCYDYGYYYARSETRADSDNTADSISVRRGNRFAEAIE